MKKIKVQFVLSCVAVFFPRCLIIIISVRTRCTRVQSAAIDAASVLIQLQQFQHKREPSAVCGAQAHFRLVPVRPLEAKRLRAAPARQQQHRAAVTGSHVTGMHENPSQTAVTPTQSVITSRQPKRFWLKPRCVSRY